MKHFWILCICALLLPVKSRAQYDDMYFVPTQKAKKEKQQQLQEAAITYYDATDDESHVADPYNNRDVDEYNRRYDYGSKTDTLIAEEGGTWVNGFDGTDADYEYSQRLLRFASPSVGIPVSSPLYWDLCYGPSSIYWNVYDDGFYAYAFPSTWNHLYYSPYFSYSWGWRPSSYYYWGWNSPWYNCWYDPWYHGHHHHPPYWGGIHKPGINHPIGNVRPVNRPSVYNRENSSLAIGGRNSSVENRSSNRTRQRTTVSEASPTRSSQRSTVTKRNTNATQGNSATRSGGTSRQQAMPTRSSSRQTVTMPTRSSSTSTISTPSRSGSSSFSPSRSSGGGSSTRGGRR